MAAAIGTELRAFAARIAWAEAKLDASKEVLMRDEARLKTAEEQLALLGKPQALEGGESKKFTDAADFQGRFPRPESWWNGDIFGFLWAMGYVRARVKPSFRLRPASLRNLSKNWFTFQRLTLVNFKHNMEALILA